MPESSGTRLLVSAVTLRRVVGTLGMALPFVVVIETWIQTRSLHLLPSISDYYSVQARDLFVGILWTIAWFFFAYRGHDRRDDIAGNAACIFALGVALVPNTAPGFLWVFHFLFATALFLTLAYYSAYLFTLSGGTAAQMTEMKKVRNKVYTLMAMIMVACIVAIGLLKLMAPDLAYVGPIPVVWFFEMVALEAFGFSWMVKGETWWKD